MQSLIYSEDFWKNIKGVVALFEPLVQLMRDFDTASPQSAWLYWRVRETRISLTNGCRDCILTDDFLSSEIMELFDKYVNEMMTDFVYTAAFLNPKYFFDTNEDVSGDATLRMGFESYLDRQVTYMVEKGIVSSKTTMMEKFMMEVAEAQQRLRGKSISSAHAQELIDKYEPAIWWHEFGSSYPCLRTLAKRVISQKIYSSSCERNWSSYGFIHNKSRNRLTNERSKDLVYVFTNYRVQHELTRVQNHWASIYHRFGKKNDNQRNMDENINEFDVEEQDEDELDNADILFGGEDNNEDILIPSIEEDEIDEDLQRLLQEEATRYPFVANEGQENSENPIDDSQFEVDPEFNFSSFRHSTHEEVLHTEPNPHDLFAHPE
jgi:hypothetical protein